MQRHCFFFVIILARTCTRYSILILILGESVGENGLGPIEKNNDFRWKIDREEKL